MQSDNRKGSRFIHHVDDASTEKAARKSQDRPWTQINLKNLEAAVRKEITESVWIDHARVQQGTQPHRQRRAREGSRSYCAKQPAKSPWPTDGHGGEKA